MAALEGLRYRLHAHLALAGGAHLESEPIEVTAAAGGSVVRLMLDAPREIHP
jgi:hypothetical protein